ncbi:hypothetical protein U9M48_044222 [Paspalum notatum var. saurae]|uniref:Uncharacterized protein n=1 Tax=Paspalum notatum var. saurae TaxID=547442 RepID=A0AAQ3XI11_PASNO
MGKKKTSIPLLLFLPPPSRLLLSRARAGNDTATNHLRSPRRSPSSPPLPLLSGTAAAADVAFTVPSTRSMPPHLHPTTSSSSEVLGYLFLLRARCRRRIRPRRLLASLLRRGLARGQRIDRQWAGSSSLRRRSRDGGVAGCCSGEARGSSGDGDGELLQRRRLELQRQRGATGALAAAARPLEAACEQEEGGRRKPTAEERESGVGSTLGG